MRLDSRTSLLAAAAALLVSVACTREPEHAGRTSSAEADPARTAPAQDLQDGWITTKIEAKYFADPQVKGRNIDVTTRNGVVSLTGVVDSDTTRQQAVSIARGTEGVSQVEDRLSVRDTAATAGQTEPASQRPPSGDSASAPVAGTAAAAKGAAADAADTASNAWTTSRIQAKYFTDDAVKGHRIDVTTNDDVVTLEGTVENAQQRERAAEIARQVEGVRRVENRLRVAGEDGGEPAESVGTTGRPAAVVPAPELPERMTDEGIATRVRAKFFQDEALTARAVDVTAANGAVTLRGEVGSEAEQQRALSLARSVEGVKDIQDQLTVTPGAATAGTQRPPPAKGLEPVAQIDDAWLTTKVQSQFFLDDLVRAGRVEVATRNGEVTLTGQLPSKAAADRAVSIAKGMEGVKNVRSELTVAGEAAGSGTGTAPPR